MIILSEFEELYDEKIPRRIECNLCLKIKVLKIDFSFKSWIYEPCFDSDLWPSKLSCRFNRYFIICPPVKLCCIHLENKVQEEGSLTARNVLPACVLSAAGLDHVMSSVWPPFCSHLASLLYSASFQGNLFSFFGIVLKRKGLHPGPRELTYRVVRCFSFLLLDLLRYLSVLHQMVFCWKPCKTSSGEAYMTVSTPRSDVKFCVCFHPSSSKRNGTILRVKYVCLWQMKPTVPFNICLSHAKYMYFYYINLIT